MYHSDSDTILDRREMLRVKLKSLAEEARIIRKEERRTSGIIRHELHMHRVRDVRSASRHTHIAYGLIRGKTIEQIEPGSLTEPNWPEVERMLKKYAGKELADYASQLEYAPADAIAA